MTGLGSKKLSVSEELRLEYEGEAMCEELNRPE